MVLVGRVSHPAGAGAIDGQGGHPPARDGTPVIRAPGNGLQARLDSDALPVGERQRGALGVGLLVEAVTVVWPVAEATQDRSRRPDERDRSGAGNDQITATGEAVRVEAAPASNEPLSAVQIGEEDAAPVGGEGERVRTEGDVAAVKQTRPSSDACLSGS